MPLELVPDDDPERLWTVPELAKNLRVSRSTLHLEITEGRMSAINVGNGEIRASYRVSESERKRWIASRSLTRRTA